ncbi:MAG: hypothetical protein WCO12_02850 [bacterium]
MQEKRSKIPLKNGKMDELTYESVPHNNASLLTDDTMKSLVELGEVLREIHNRLVSEGYTIENGKIKKLDVIEF